MAAIRFFPAAVAGHSAAGAACRRWRRLIKRASALTFPALAWMERSYRSPVGQEFYHCRIGAARAERITAGITPR
jgi:hypothetical protein